jgi:ABC-type nitrate/sulfonate/bicarbonate transport system substrate-binding protein
MFISLQKNGIDGAVLQDPSFFMAEDAGFKTLADPAAMDIQYLQNVLVASRAYLRSHRDAALRFMKAFVEGVAWSRLCFFSSRIFPKRKPAIRTHSSTTV